MPTERQVAEVAIAAINAELPASVRATTPDEVPPERPDEYVVVTIVRRPGGPSRAGRRSTTGWGLYVMAASKFAVTNAQDSLAAADRALDSVRLTVAGEETTPIAFATARAVGPDDGAFSGTSTYNFAL